MYQQHNVFVQPADDGVKVWRYMDFTKLVSLIDSRRLFFTRADKFEDPYEGTWPRRSLEELKRRGTRDHLSWGHSLEALPPYLEHLVEQYKTIRENYAINCWHLNQQESAAMWKLYLKSDEGIAVQSTYGRFRDALTDSEGVFVGLVNYIDYENELIDPVNLLSAIVHKRKSFEHEREVRAVIPRWPMVGAPNTIGPGLKVKVDLELLIENIYVAPDAPGWFAELVKGVIAKYGYHFPVIHSKLYEAEIY